MGLKTKIFGSGYVVLNVIRGLNIVSLLACVAAAVSMLIKTFIINNYFFFDSIGHVVTILMSGFLIISELPFSFLKNYFQKNWPLLSTQSGFVTLGIFMMIDGVMVLGNLNSSDANSKSLGSSFFQVIEAGGIIAFITGIFNIIASYIFRDRKVGVTARMVRASGATAAQKIANDVYYQNSVGTPALPRSQPSVRTVVSSTNGDHDHLPFYNRNSAAPNRMPSVSSLYSQSTRAGGEVHMRDPKLELIEEPLPTHPAHRDVEFV
ncbi:hypothetical protein MMC10_001133 [Thelotrema lepadinum]|nr:hypothetical protein [Thelotrema lepadinum]